MLIQHCTNSHMLHLNSFVFILFINRHGQHCQEWCGVFFFLNKQLNAKLLLYSNCFCNIRTVMPKEKWRNPGKVCSSSHPHRTPAVVQRFMQGWKNVLHAIVIFSLGRKLFRSIWLQRRTWWASRRQANGLWGEGWWSGWKGNTFWNRYGVLGEERHNLDYIQGCVYKRRN